LPGAFGVKSCTAACSVAFENDNSSAGQRIQSSRAINAEECDQRNIDFFTDRKPVTNLPASTPELKHKMSSVLVCRL
jgi:hypothetical protein